MSTITNLPSQAGHPRVALTKHLRVRAPTVAQSDGDQHEAAGLIKVLHRTGGQPLGPQPKSYLTKASPQQIDDVPVDFFYDDYLARIRKREGASGRRATLRKSAPGSAQPLEFELITNHNEWHALVARHEREDHRQVVDLIRQGQSTARINAITGERLP